MIKDLMPDKETHWFAFHNGILRTGFTEAGQVTSADTDEFEFGPDILEKIEKHKDKLQDPGEEKLEPGIYRHEDTVVLVTKAECAGATISQILEAREAIK
jgi:hypothetical protein